MQPSKDGRNLTSSGEHEGSDFGRHQVIMNRYGNLDSAGALVERGVVFCLDPSYWAVRYLRRPFKRELAKTGDATKYQILTEWGLVARNWKANSKIVGCATAA